MRIRGALHVHSSLSHDGTLTLTELATWYRAHGYNFLAITEHAQDMHTKTPFLLDRSARNSSSEFCVIPGMEFECKGGLHILGLGVTTLVRGFDPIEAIETIRGLDGYAVLAHPKRNGWKCPPEVVRSVNAVELWNIRYDGKFLPSPQSLIGFRKMRQTNPDIYAVAGHDFHHKGGFYDTAIEMDVASVTAEPILQNLRRGQYTIRAPLFKCSAQAEFSWFQSARLHLLSWQVGKLRGLRNLLLPRSS